MVGKFKDIEKLNKNYYSLFCDLTDNKTNLGEKMVKVIQKSLYKKYLLDFKTLTFDDKFEFNNIIKEKKLTRKQLTTAVPLDKQSAFVKFPQKSEANK